MSAPPGPASAPAFQEAMREEDVPAQQPEAQEEARFPASYAQSRGSRGGGASASQGTQRPVGLIWRVRDRASFRALAASRRHRQGVLTMTRVASDVGDPPRVAFAIGRPVGNAVVRNRLRRQLRALCQTHASEMLPGHSYLVGALPAAPSATFRELDDAFRALLTATASTS
jgi:ribonuclease P protein component